jgi:SHS2 domain-containing protein
MISYYTEVMGESPYVEVEHTADWSLHIRAESMEGLLFNASKGMFQLMQIERGEQLLSQRKISIDAHDREELLVTWLEELLFHIETHGVSFVIEEIILSDNEHQLEASLSEYALVNLEKEIKAVTYHGLHVTETEDGIEATLVFDV